VTPEQQQMLRSHMTVSGQFLPPNGSSAIGAKQTYDSAPSSLIYCNNTLPV